MARLLLLQFFGSRKGYKMKTIDASEAQFSLQELIARAVQEKEQFHIQAQEGDAVLLSQETYNNLLVTLEVLTTPGLMDGLGQLQEER